MSHVVKCSRLLPRYCQSLHRCSSNIASKPPENGARPGPDVYPNIPLMAGAATVIGTLYLMSYNAKAKEAGEDEAAMSALIEDALAPTQDVLKTVEHSRFDKWADVQHKYLLLHETRRAEIAELRESVTPEELGECDALYNDSRFGECEEKLTELNTWCPHNDEILWRLARVKWIYGTGIQASMSHKVFHVGYNLAYEAVQKNPGNGDAHRWLAIMSYHKAVKDGKVATCLNLEGMKYHLEKAVELNPHDHVSWTLLGNWYFEVADMSRQRRMWCRYIAKVEPPAASYELAMECFMKSNSVQPWTQTTNFIARTHLRMGNRKQAIAMLERLSRIVIVTNEDFRVRKEAHIMLMKLNNPSLKDKFRDLFESPEKYRFPAMYDSQTYSFGRPDMQRTATGRIDAGCARLQ